MEGGADSRHLPRQPHHHGLLRLQRISTAHSPLPNSDVSR
jgi:hypothetical protein